VALVVLCGIALGVLSRVEETAGFPSLISTDSAWVGTAFAIGALSGSVRDGSRRGAIGMSSANAGYYAWVALTQPNLPLAAVAGPVERWIALGLLTGVVFGVAGRLWRDGSLLAPLALSTVLVLERAGSPLLP
jgi:hypothetical protein